MGEQVGLIRISQEHETSAQAETFGPFHLTYAYARSAEGQSADQPGQDYIVWRTEGSRLVFALCDGVSQSFYGELAARFLGDALVDWLWQLPLSDKDAAGPATLLTEQLSAWTAAATGLVQEQILPPGIPEMQRVALEQKRALGSQSMFVAGRIDLPDASLPRGRLLCCWLGDCRLRAWRGNVEEPRLSIGRDTAQRWSTRTGAVGGTVCVLSSGVKGRTYLAAAGESSLFSG